MATYFDINGQKVEYLSSDPSPVTEGQVWYNSATQIAKVQGYSAGAWASGGNLPTPTSANSGSASTPAGFSMGGGTGPVASYVSATNTYDGTSWTAAPAMTLSSAYAAACGIIPTTIYAGGDGNPPGASNTYDGSSWTGIPALGFDGYQMKGAGNKANAFLWGGYYSSSAYNWNGSSFATSPAAPQHNYNVAAAGTHDDASFLGGYAVSGGSASNLHQHWNGSGWTTRTVIPVSGGASMSSNNAPTSNLWYQADKTTTLTWDGSSWATVGSLSTGRVNAGSGGTSSAEGFVCGGNAPPGSNVQIATEEFTAGPVTKTITTS